MRRIQKYLIHAEKFGCESVYEAAEFYLDPDEQAGLAKGLRRLDPKWSLEWSARQRLLASLTEEGWTDQKIGEALGISRRAAFDARTELAARASQNDVTKPEKSAVFGGVAHAPTYPENFTPHRSGAWQSWVYGGAKMVQPGGTDKEWNRAVRARHKRTRPVTALLSRR